MGSCLRVDIMSCKRSVHGIVDSFFEEVFITFYKRHSSSSTRSLFWIKPKMIRNNPMCPNTF